MKELFESKRTSQTEFYIGSRPSNGEIMFLSKFIHFWLKENKKKFDCKNCFKREGIFSKAIFPHFMFFAILFDFLYDLQSVFSFLVIGNI
jgi:hypothetical protein